MVGRPNTGPIVWALVMLALTAGALVLLWIYPMHSAVRIQFFEIGAQVIPVLLLVLAVEQRVFETSYTTDETDRSLRVAFIAAFGIAEALALWVVATGRTSATVFVVTGTAIVWGLVLVFASVQNRRSSRPTPWLTKQAVDRTKLMAEGHDDQ